MSFTLLPEDSTKPAQSSDAEPPSTLRKVGEAAAESARPIARLGSRVLEQAVGLPGDVFSLLNNFVAGPISESITGDKAIPYEDTYLGKLIPTTETHREGIKNATGGFLEPRNNVEGFIDDIATDTAALLAPIKTKVPFKRTLTRALGTSIGANLIGSTAEDITGSEGKGAAAKIGSLFALSLVNKPAAAKHASELYKKAESLLPEGAKANAEVLSSNLNGLKKKILSGRPESSLAPSEKFVVEEADNILGQIKDGKIGVNSAWASKRSLNEKLQKVLYESPDKKSRARAGKLATQIQHSLKNTIEGYGKQNPEFYKNFGAAEEALGTISKSNAIARFAEKNLKYSPLTSGLVYLFKGAIPMAGAATGAIIPYQAGKILYRINQSPTLRKYYGDVLKSAAKEDALIFNKDLQKLDKGLQADEGKDSFKLVED